MVLGHLSHPHFLACYSHEPGGLVRAKNILGERQEEPCVLFQNSLTDPLGPNLQVRYILIFPIQQTTSQAWSCKHWHTRKVREREGIVRVPLLRHAAVGIATRKRAEFLKVKTNIMVGILLSYTQSLSLPWLKNF